MPKLGLDVFLGAGADFEKAQYHVLGGLQHSRQAFSSNVIYPHLRDLVELYHTLQVIDKRLADVKEAMKGEIKAIDLGMKTILYEKPEMGPDEVEYVRDLIRWALPHVQETIEEGQAIYEFVEDSVHIEEVGIVPSYLREGYLIVPARETSELYVLQYELSMFMKAGERYRSLRTRHIKSLPQGTVYRSPQAIKLELLEEQRELPNPATFFFSTSLDFPFEHTMLPVVKRKLIRHLTDEEA